VTWRITARKKHTTLRWRGVSVEKDERRSRKSLLLNVQVISGKFLGDFQRHYDEKGYKIFDWVYETNPLAYFTALVGLSKIVRVPADVTHRDGSSPIAPPATRTSPAKTNSDHH
jgi:hypothetical protein